MEPKTLTTLKKWFRVFTQRLYIIAKKTNVCLKFGLLRNTTKHLELSIGLTHKRSHVFFIAEVQFLMGSFQKLIESI